MSDAPGTQKDPVAVFRRQWFLIEAEPEAIADPNDAAERYDAHYGREYGHSPDPSVVDEARDLWVEQCLGEATKDQRADYEARHEAVAAHVRTDFRRSASAASVQRIERRCASRQRSRPRSRRRRITRSSARSGDSPDGSSDGPGADDAGHPTDEGGIW